MSKKKRTPNKPSRGGARKSHGYPFEFRLRAVRFYLEEGYSSKMICDELGVGRDSLLNWVKRYKERGEDGLKNNVWSGKSKVSGDVKSKIVSDRTSASGKS